MNIPESEADRLVKDFPTRFQFVKDEPIKIPESNGSGGIELTDVIVDDGNDGPMVKKSKKPKNNKRYNPKKDK
jgi:hypothetical protein